MKCSNCKGSDVEEFFHQKNVPIKSVVTIKTFDEAIAVPKKDLTLTFCNTCGFIFNSSFEDNVSLTKERYEDQQGYSSTWLKFITGVTEEFIAKYNIRDKDIIEIGCGKGDFLQLICKLGNNRGIGIDPAYVSGRLEHNPNVRFIKEFFSEKHENLPVDVIICRHTLEHIHETFNFVNTIRKTINKNKDIIVLIEVPNVLRILKMNAFWDIYYEHCSYFSPGSLARLFRKSQFEVLDASLEYNEQYLLMEAKPIQNSLVPFHPLEESVEQLKKHVVKFVVEIKKELSNWRKLLLQLKDENKKVVIWGGGSKSVGFLTHFNDLQLIRYVVDINPHMQGNFIPGVGIQYVHPEFLKAFKPEAIIIMNGIYKNEISKMLIKMNIAAKLYCL